ncbi:MAG: hypothetical protein ACLQBX_08250 [Candidatus Limnocylindrales bacterium]
MDDLGSAHLPARLHLYGQDYRSQGGAVEAVAGEPVVAILEATNGAERLLFVCTPNRGVARGLPVYVGSRQVQTVTDFAREAPA